MSKTHHPDLGFLDLGFDHFWSSLPLPSGMFKLDFVSIRILGTVSAKSSEFGPESVLKIRISDGQFLTSKTDHGLFMVSF